MFERLHHQRIAHVLEALDADVLAAHMAISTPKAVLWQKIRRLKRLLPPVSG